jgi:hypothetical protein
MLPLVATPQTTIRIDDETKARWTAHAKDDGYTFSEFVKACVEDVIARRSEAPARAPESPSKSPPARRLARVPSAPIPKGGDLAGRFKPDFKPGAAPTEKKAGRRR